MAPRLYSGTKAWSYFPHGYGKSKSSLKKSRPFLVRAKRASGSKDGAIEARQ